jgi:hypothetical protein
MAPLQQTSRSWHPNPCGWPAIRPLCSKVVIPRRFRRGELPPRSPPPSPPLLLALFSRGRQLGHDSQWHGPASPHTPCVQLAERPCAPTRGQIPTLDARPPLAL